SASSRQPRQLADNVSKLQGHHAWEELPLRARSQIGQSTSEDRPLRFQLAWSAMSKAQSVSFAHTHVSVLPGSSVDKSQLTDGLCTYVPVFPAQFGGQRLPQSNALRLRLCTFQSRSMPSTLASSHRALRRGRSKWRLLAPQCDFTLPQHQLQNVLVKKLFEPQLHGTVWPPKPFWPCRTVDIIVEIAFDSAGASACSCSAPRCVPQQGSAPGNKFKLLLPSQFRKSFMSLQPFIGATDLHTHTCRGWGIFSDCVFLHCARRYDTRHNTSDSQLLSPDRGGKARPQGSMEYGAEIQSALKRLMPVQWCSGMLSCGSPGQSRHIASLPFNLMRGIATALQPHGPRQESRDVLLNGQDVSARRRVPKPSLQAAGSHDSWQTMSPSCKATMPGLQMAASMPGITFEACIYPLHPYMREVQEQILDSALPQLLCPMSPGRNIPGFGHADCHTCLAEMAGKPRFNSSPGPLCSAGASHDRRLREELPLRVRSQIGQFGRQVSANGRSLHIRLGPPSAVRRLTPTTVQRIAAQAVGPGGVRCSLKASISLASPSGCECASLSFGRQVSANGRSLHIRLGPPSAVRRLTPTTVQRIAAQAVGPGGVRCSLKASISLASPSGCECAALSVRSVSVYGFGSYSTALRGKEACGTRLSRRATASRPQPDSAPGEIQTSLDFDQLLQSPSSSWHKGASTCHMMCCHVTDGCFYARNHLRSMHLPAAPLHEGGAGAGYDFRFRLAAALVSDVAGRKVAMMSGLQPRIETATSQASGARDATSQDSATLTATVASRKWLESRASTAVLAHCVLQVPVTTA
ncbi:unnamed protein product, partial [Polarella glacialis]